VRPWLRMAFSRSVKVAISLGAGAALLSLCEVVPGSCGRPVAAADVCQKLREAGVAVHCRPDKPSAFVTVPDAFEVEVFDWPSVPGKGGAVFRFRTTEAYEAIVNSVGDPGALSGPYWYGSRRRRIFVQFEGGTSMDLRARARSVIDGL